MNYWMDAPLPKCIDGKDHEFRSIMKPQGNRSGWHIEECIHCGIHHQYDTSD